MRVLVVDDDKTLRDLLVHTLKLRNYQTFEAADGQEALDMLQASQFDAIILDVNMPKVSGIEVLEKVRELSPRTFCVVMTAYADVKDAVNAIKLGAYDYLEKPVEPEKVLQIFEHAKASNHLIEIAAFSAPSVNFDAGREIIGGSTPIRKVFEVINKLGKVDTSVLIRGESGTGKELIARAVHFNSHRRKGPFVAVNCAAIPENLIESELFGHEKGAFTGADRKKPGKFQFSEGGTIFLDEIGDINVSMQVKLLRALQEKAVTPVGASAESKISVRVIAATNRPLEDMMEKGTFRSDLYFRLNVLPINLPPLRDRREDIPALLNFMIEKFNQSHDRRVRRFDHDALRLLTAYSWPGNIRELENIVERAFILESGDILGLDSLPPEVHANGTGPRAADVIAPAPTAIGGRAEATPRALAGLLEANGEGLNYPKLKEQFEREFIIKALMQYKGRINQTAQHTQMTKITLLRKLEKYGINANQFRNQAVTDGSPP